MKILAVCGSPRKGNCYSMLNSIKENYPAIDFKVLMLNEVNLEMCKGDYGCILNGEKYCPLKDDRDMIIQEMSDADGVVFASPTYSLQIPALMKNFFDRTGYLAHRPRFFDKFAMVMATGAGYGIDGPNKYMSKILSAFGFTVVSSVELQTLPKKLMSEKRVLDNQKKTFKAFDTLIAGIKKGEMAAPSVGLVVVFNLFKSVSEAFKDVWKADYQFYKDKTNYYYDTKIPFYKKMIAKRYVSKVMKN